MRHLFAYGCFIALIAVLPQASHAAWQQKVLVTTPILEPIVAGLMEGLGKAESLTNNAQSPHQTSYTPQQAKALHDAEVVVALDANIAPGLKKILAQRAKEGALVIYLTTLKEIDPLPYRQNNPFLATEKEEEEEHDHHKHEHRGIDPHFWLDPLRVANMLPALGKKIATYWPEDDAGLQRNATRMALHLRAEVHPEISNIIAAAKQRQSDSSKAVPVMTYHDAYQYFQKRYGLEAGYITQRPEEYTGAKTMKTLLTKANLTHVRCLLSEIKNDHAKRIAALSQASIVTLNPERPYTTQEVPHAPWLKNDYDRMLMAVAKAYAGCL
jgi:zinc transport system substrate-binding protein